MKIDYAAQCRFFTPEDACRIALQAYYAAAKHLEPPPGEPWMIDGQPWCDATYFAESFNGELQARLALLALDRLGDFYQVHQSWHLLRLACDIEPEKIAPLLAKHEAESQAMHAEFFGDEKNHLPPSDNPVHNRETGVSNNAG